MIEELLRLAGSEVGVSVLVVPNDGALLSLITGSAIFFQSKSGVSKHVSHGASALHLPENNHRIQDQPAAGLPVIRSNAFHRELPKVWAEGHNPEAQAEPDPPAPLGEMISAGSLQVLIEAPRPVSYIVGGDILEIHGVSHCIHIPGVHSDRAAEGWGAADELRNHNHALLRLATKGWAPLPAYGVLVRHQVHSVPDRVDHTAFRNRVDDWLIIRRAEPVVDLLCNHEHLLVDLLHILSLASCWIRNLDQDCAPPPFLVFFQELTHGQELQAYALKQIHVLAHVYANGEDLDADRPPVVLQADVPPLGLVVDPQHPAAAGQEVAGIVEGVESDEVRVEERPENLLPDGQRPVHLRRREGGVKEEAEFDAVRSPPEEGGEKHKVIVVHPHVVLVCVKDLGHGVSEDPVGGDVGQPEGAVEADATEGGRGDRKHVVEERPEIVLTEAMGSTAASGSEDGGRMVPTWRISHCGGNPARSCRERASGSHENRHRRVAGSRWLRMGS
ncbi:unnamed protein product [Spirodela intermedia]|uniref:Uncharacterized protein n=1 Tax=Spirodela intermedia TaxID=51605 RepID=A0A7I8LDR1_SPIIN|nr:unnamed protein product [Spirodela intermedia]